MSSEKTEKPTPKKLREAAEKGQSFKSRDMIAALMLICGLGWLVGAGSLKAVQDLFRFVIAHNFQVDSKTYATELILTFARLAGPVLVACLAVVIVSSLMQSGFQLAPKAIKLDLTAVNPVNGFSKLFSMRTLKDLIKAILYLMVFAGGAYLFWRGHSHDMYAQIYTSYAELGSLWAKLGYALVLTLLVGALPIIVIDALAEYYLYIKNLMMDKHEVKQEYKESEGNPHIKSRRREFHMEILSEQMKSDISQSKFILANPTHIAIGIYIREETMSMPFVSVLETNQRAIAVIRYAEKIGIPVVRNIPVARKIFKHAKRYSFIRLEDLHGIVDIVRWLLQVEMAGLAQERGNAVVETAVQTKSEGNGMTPGTPDPEQP